MQEKCDWCYTAFDPNIESSKFSSKFNYLSFSKLSSPYTCAECAITALEKEKSQVYIDLCRVCNQESDYITQSKLFRLKTNGNDLYEQFKDGYICCDCALVQNPALDKNPISNIQNSKYLTSLVNKNEAHE